MSAGLVFFLVLVGGIGIGGLVSLFAPVRWPRWHSKPVPADELVCVSGRSQLWRRGRNRDLVCDCGYACAAAYEPCAFREINDIGPDGRFKPRRVTSRRMQS